MTAAAAAGAEGAASPHRAACTATQTQVLAIRIAEEAKHRAIPTVLGPEMQAL